MGGGAERSRAVFSKKQMEGLDHLKVTRGRSSNES